MACFSLKEVRRQRTCRLRVGDFIDQQSAKRTRTFGIARLGPSQVRLTSNANRFIRCLPQYLQKIERTPQLHIGTVTITQ